MKLTIVGRGSVGCINVLHFLRYTDWEIDWVYDSSISTTSVGEGTNLIVPRILDEYLTWDFNDLAEIGGTIKKGIFKENWGQQNKSFFHSFPLGHTGIHMNAVTLQDKIYSIIKDHPRVNLIDKNVKNPENLDSNFVMMCTGSPKGLTDYVKRKYIPVNSCYVTQCYWEKPEFDYTLTIARPYGWVFGIPLQNRCSIGYLFNSDINNVNEVKNDVQHIFERFNLTPSDTTRTLHFDNYSRLNNFSNKIVYNGNASFFLEPLEATSLGTSDTVMRAAFDVWHGNITPELAQANYNNVISDTESMIAMHYMAGSAFNSDFWDYAVDLGEKNFLKNAENNTDFYDIIKGVCTNFNAEMNRNEIREVATWWPHSYKKNIEGLGIHEMVNSIISIYK